MVFGKYSRWKLQHKAFMFYGLNLDLLINLMITVFFRHVLVVNFLKCKEKLSLKIQDLLVCWRELTFYGKIGVDSEFF